MELLALALALPPEVRAQATDFPQAKINMVDLSAAPEVRIWVSLLDKRLHQPAMDKWLEKLTVIERPRRGKRRDLFTIVDGEPALPELEEDEDPGPLDRDAPITLGTAAEQPGGMAVLVIVPGSGEAAHLGSLGQRIQEGVGQLFKKLGKGHRINVIWATDQLASWVKAKGRTRELTTLTPEILARCQATQLEELERYGEEPEEEEEEEDAPRGLDPESAWCGLSAEVEGLDEIIHKQPFQGFYPHVFGLGQAPCGPPEQPRMAAGRFGTQATAEEAEEDEEGRSGALAEAWGPSALDLGLRWLAEGAGPRQPRALVLLGDGRDGYIHRLEECRTFQQAGCRKSFKTWNKQRRCLEEGQQNLIIRDQEAFARRLGGWLALATASGTRIFTLSTPEASEHERERLELLAWRTGGTSRQARDANELGERTIELVEELTGQVVVTFTDRDAVPGAERRYQVKLEGQGHRFVTPPFEATVAPVAEGFDVTLASMRQSMRGSLGKYGLWAILAVVGLILMVIFFKLGKKALGAAKGKAKGAKGGAAAAKSKQAAARAAAAKLKKARAAAKKGG